MLANMLSVCVSTCSLMSVTQQLLEVKLHNAGSVECILSFILCLLTSAGLCWLAYVFQSVVSLLFTVHMLWICVL